MRFESVVEVRGRRKVEPNPQRRKLPSSANASPWRFVPTEVPMYPGRCMEKPPASSLDVSSCAHGRDACSSGRPGLTVPTAGTFLKLQDPRHPERPRSEISLPVVFPGSGSVVRWPRPDANLRRHVVPAPPTLSSGGGVYLSYLTSCARLIARAQYPRSPRPSAIDR